MTIRLLHRTIPIAASAALLGVILPALAGGLPRNDARHPAGAPMVVADVTSTEGPGMAGRMHHVYSCDAVNHTWSDVMVPNAPGGPTGDVVDPYYRNACPFGNPLVPAYRAKVPTGGMHHVYSCDTVNHTWNDITVPNAPGGPTGDVVEPFYRTGCPYGSPSGGFVGTASTATRPYVDSTNPLDSSHTFH